MSSDGVTTDGTEVTRGRLLEVWPQKCVFVVEEIMKTEQDYVASLRQIIEGYLKPMHSHLFEQAGSPLSIAAVFGNITQLHEFNTALEEQLKGSMDDPTAFGEVFVKNKDNFMCYAEYCTNYKTAVKYLAHLIDNKPHLGAFIAQCQKNLHHTFSLHDRLLKPVQRILKYQLLLENLLKPLGPDHCGYVSISEARTSMTEVADHINKMVKVQEVYSALQHSEATVPLKKMALDRELVHEGVCRIGKTREIELVLFQKLLLFFRKEMDGSYIYEDHILVDELCLEEDPKDHKHFTISSKKQATKKYSLQVPFPDDRKVWVDKIEQIKTGAGQNTIALNRKKTVQNLSRLKLQSSRRETIQTSRQNRLAVRLSVPLDTEEQSQDRTFTAGKLQRSRAVRLRKVLSTDCSSSAPSYLTSNQWRPLSPNIRDSSHTSHILQTDHDDTNGSVSPQDTDTHLAVSVTDYGTNGGMECPPDVEVCPPYVETYLSDVEGYLSDESLKTLDQLPDDRPHPPKPDDGPNPLIVNDKSYLANDRPNLQQDVDPHPPDVIPHPPSPDSRSCPPPSSNSRPHSLRDHDNEITKQTAYCKDSLPPDRRLNGNHRIKVTDYLLKKSAFSSQSDQHFNQSEAPSSPGHLKMTARSDDDGPSQVTSLSNTAEQWSGSILYASREEQSCHVIPMNTRPFHK